MGGITIEELGMKFVDACMKLYWGPCWYPALFAIGLIATLIWGRKKSSMIFIGCTAVLFLTVYNPVVVKYIIAKLGFDKEYYRFIWLLPVIPGVAYYGVKAVCLFPKRWMKAAAAAVLLGIFVLFGNPLDRVVNNFAFAENIYKVPDELIQVCGIIHENQNNPEQMARVVFDGTLNNKVRQYDASMRLIISRNSSIYRAGSTVTGVYDENSDGYKRQKALLDVVDYQLYDDMEAFKKALQETRTEFVVVSKNEELQKVLEENDCERIGETVSYNIFRFVG